MSKQPNIVLIMADQVNPSFLPMYGHPVVKMPNLEKIAAEGVVFDTAYCNNPICAPSRFSILTGRLASELKVFDHGCEIPASVPTLMHYLRLHGYHTSIRGRNTTRTYCNSSCSRSTAMWIAPRTATPLVTR